MKKEIEDFIYYIFIVFIYLLTLIYGFKNIKKIGDYLIKKGTK